MAKSRTSNKSGFNSDSFLNRLQEKSKIDMAVTGKMQTDETIYDKYTEGRTIEFINDDLLMSAPDEWNRFPRLKSNSPAKYAELLMSININGIWQPLIVWQQKNGKYMILAGHNRREANKENYDRYKDDPVVAKRFETLPCIVYKNNELTEFKAREIIIDTNYIQRQDNTRTTAWVVKNRMDLLQEQKTSKGESIEEISKALDIKKSCVYENLAIVEKVIEPLQNLYYDEIVTRKAILKVTSITKELQQQMYDKYQAEITDSKLLHLNKTVHSMEQIDEIFGREDQDVKKVKVNIPKERYRKTKSLIEAFQNVLPYITDEECAELLNYLNNIK